MPHLPARVLLITDRYPPHVGGLARSACRLAQHACALGAHTHVLVLRAEGPPGVLSSAREADTWVHRLSVSRDPASAGQQASQTIAWLHEREGFHLLHGHYGSTAGFLAAYQARLLGVASYVGLRGNDLDRDAHDPSRFPPLLWALQHASVVGAVSRALAHQAQQLSGRSDVRYMPNSVDGSLFRPVAPDPDLRVRLGLDDAPVIGFAGELREKKGAAFLLEAYRCVAAHTGAQLLLVGALRPDARALLEQLLQEAPHVAGRIHVCPYVQDQESLAAVYGLMDLVVCPSLWEGMPNLVLEAMACARPVLASDAGGIPDVLTHGSTGWLLSRHRLHRLGDAMREVLDLPAEERLAVGQRARAHVLSEFPPERERRELGEAYAAALARH